MNSSIKPMPNLTERNIKNFWDKVDKSGDCWLWTATVDIGGYGRCAYFLQKYKATYFKASRVSYFLSTGIDPANKFVCHKCDNPKCVNPSHLFLGTHLDNIKDAQSKNRKIQGSKVYNSKLTEDSVVEIRKLREQGVKMEALAVEFGCNASNIHGIVHRKKWKHV